MKPAVALTDKERFPLINDLSFLNQLKQDDFAPNFNFQSGDRLTAEHLEKVTAYEKQIRFQKDFAPVWLDEFIKTCVATVPFYKERSLLFQDQPTISRADLREAPWLFVSDGADLNDMLVYQTSGTTGPAMDVLFDPVMQACWLPQLQSILDLFNIHLSKDPRKVAIALICAQASTLTYASLSSYLEGAGILKINLNDADWKGPGHSRSFLEKFNPEILTGDPFAFMALMELKPNLRPKAMVSSAMKLTQSLKEKLEAYFQCPVIDVYSLTECRMIAFAENKRHRAIRPDLYLEIFDEQADIVLPHGQRGELVVTGGNNPFLPLIRYRTGDFCSLQIENGIPYLIDLEARKTVPFYTRQHQLVNNVDISRAFTGLPLAGFHLHQSKNYSLSFTAWSNEQNIEATAKQVLTKLFGNDVEISVSIKSSSDAPQKKIVNYTTELL